ncbi:hypothetical protein LXL04_004423 [Taraxacum kok-saghyz]
MHADEGQALKAEGNRGRGDNRWPNTHEDRQTFKVENGRGRGRGSFRGGRGRGRGRQQPVSKAHIECYKCHNLGHFQNECPTWGNEAQFASLEEDEEMMLMAQIDEELLHKAEVEKDKVQVPVMHNNMWFLDSGYSNHMYGDKDKFQNIEDCSKGYIKCGNNSKMKVAGKWNMKLMFNGVVFNVQDVYYVPDLRHNLLSVGWNAPISRISI